MRSTVADFARTRAPKTLGICAENLPDLLSYINEATERLIRAAGDTGWWGTWHRVAFQVDACAYPYITLPTQYARMSSIDVCRRPIKIQNEWYEFLEYGAGLQSPDPNNPRRDCGLMEAFDRNTFSTAFDLSPTNQYLRVYYTDPRDVGKRILFYKALDQNGEGIYTQDGLNPVDGFILNLTAPFVQSAFIVTAFQAVSKDQTFGDVVVKQVDATTGAEVFLARYKPNDITPSYRRYYLNRLPKNCCVCGESSVVTVETLLKVEFQPVYNYTDFLLIGNLAALKEECISIRYSEMDNAGAATLSMKHHADAIKLLNQELAHYVGKNRPAINLAMFGSAKPEFAGIGTMI